MWTCENCWDCIHILTAHSQGIQGIISGGEALTIPSFYMGKIEVNEDVGSHLNSEEGDDYSCTFSQEVINPWDIIACADTPSE